MTGQPPCLVSGLCNPSATTVVIFRTGACTSAPAAGDAIQIVSPTATSDACLSSFAGPAGSLCVGVSVTVAVEVASERKAAVARIESPAASEERGTVSPSARCTIAELGKHGGSVACGSTPGGGEGTADG